MVQGNLNQQESFGHSTSFFSYKIIYLPDYQALSTEDCAERPIFLRRCLSWKGGSIRSRSTSDISTDDMGKYSRMKKDISKFFFVHFGIWRNAEHIDEGNLVFEDVYDGCEYVCIVNIGDTDHKDEDSDIEIPTADTIVEPLLITNVQRYSLVRFTRSFHV